MMYALRVGTSSCDKALRISSMNNVSGNDGMKAAAIRNKLDGMCVNTIVFREILKKTS